MIPETSPTYWQKRVVETIKMFWQYLSFCQVYLETFYCQRLKLSDAWSYCCFTRLKFLSVKKTVCFFLKSCCLLLFCECLVCHESQERLSQSLRTMLPSHCLTKEEYFCATVHVLWNYYLGNRPANFKLEGTTQQFALVAHFCSFAFM